MSKKKAKPAPEPKPGQKCGLCDTLIPPDELLGQFCHGCKTLICDKHTSDSPWGSHSPKDHEHSDDVEEFYDE